MQTCESHHLGALPPASCEPASMGRLFEAEISVKKRFLESSERLLHALSDHTDFEIGLNRFSLCFNAFPIGVISS